MFHLACQVREVDRKEKIWSLFSITLSPLLNLSASSRLDKSLMTAICRDLLSEQSAAGPIIARQEKFPTPIKLFQRRGCDADFR